MNVTLYVSCALMAVLNLLVGVKDLFLGGWGRSLLCIHVLEYDISVMNDLKGIMVLSVYSIWSVRSKKVPWYVT